MQFWCEATPLVGLPLSGFFDKLLLEKKINFHDPNFKLVLKIEKNLHAISLTYSFVLYIYIYIYIYIYYDDKFINIMSYAMFYERYYSCSHK